MFIIPETIASNLINLRVLLILTICDFSNCGANIYIFRNSICQKGDGWQLF